MKRERSAVISVVAAAGLCTGLVQAQELKPIFGQARDPIMEAPVIACFAEGTDPAYVRRVETIVQLLNQARFGGAADYQLTGRWSGNQGDPRALTWSFVPDGLSISSGAGEPVAPSNLFATMDVKFGNRATWVAQYAAVFARWQALSGITYTRITVGGNDWDDGAGWGTGGAAGVRGDLRFAGKTIDGASGILAYNFFPANGDMVVDTAESWQNASNSFRFLRNTLAHEHGHGIGLLHVCPIANTKLLEPFLSTAFDGPQQDDIRAVQRHYGDPYEGNNTSGTAKPMGALAIPSTMVFGNIPSPAVTNAALLSIDADAETDFFSFTVTGPCTLTATATPIGSTYNHAPQTNPCGAGTAVNALAQADLAIAVIGTNGSTILGQSSSAAVGVAETVSNVGIPAAGTYFIRVTEANSPAESQLYRITLDASGQAVCPQITQHPQSQTACENNPVSFTVAASGTPNPTFQWRRNTVNIPGATSATYNIVAVSPGQAGTYDCVATNNCGSVTSNGATLAVNTVPVFTQHPSNQTVPQGSQASFTVAASGNPTPSYFWRKDGSFIPGANAATYTIVSVQPSDVGTYDCIASNDCDQALSNPATLTIGGTSCYANCDESSGSPLLTANDFQCFLNKFAAGDSYANCDQSTGNPTLTANDFQCFLNTYAAGCS